MTNQFTNRNIDLVNLYNNKCQLPVNILTDYLKNKQDDENNQRTNLITGTVMFSSILIVSSMLMCLIPFVGQIGAVVVTSGLAIAGKITLGGTAIVLLVSSISSISLGIATRVIVYEINDQNSVNIYERFMINTEIVDTINKYIIHSQFARSDLIDNYLPERFFYDYIDVVYMYDDENNLWEIHAKFTKEEMTEIIQNPIRLII